MSFGKNVAQSIARTATDTLTARAAYIVNQCTSPGCRTSVGTQNQVITGLNTLANSLAQDTIKGLQLPASAPASRSIIYRFTALAYTIAITFTTECINTGDASSCTENASAVKINEMNLAAVLENPVAAESKEIIIVSIYAILALIVFGLCLLFVLLGILEWLFSSKPKAPVVSTTPTRPLTSADFV